MSNSTPSSLKFNSQNNQSKRTRENTISNTLTASSPSSENVAAAKTPPMPEFAGNASPLLSPHTASSPSIYLWNADTGATSHMTPHRHWLRDYTPLHVPIRLADNTTVYSKGVGNVVFKPVISGKVTRAVKFTRVLHIPDLQNNLLTVLYLSRQRGIDVHISPTDLAMKFSLNGEQLFVAPINPDNSAFLAGETETLSVRYKERYLKACAQRSLCRRYVTQLFEAQL